jgi:C4-dicarboxylate-specific signal transduction histidine kinase
MHGPDQRHNTSECKVINGEIEKLKGAKKALFGKNKDSQQGAKPNWMENKKRTATSYSTEQLKEVIKMTRKKALNDARAQYEIQAEAQAQAELNAIQINDHANHELEKMRQMELFITHMVDDDESGGV